MYFKNISLLTMIALSGSVLANNGLYDAVAPLVLASEQLAEPVVKPDEAAKKQEGILEKIDRKAGKLSKELTHIEKLRILFNIFTLDGDLNGEILTQHALTEPYILPGAGLPKRSSLIGVIQPETVVGEAVLAARLSAPITDLTEIEKRRDALKFLVENDSLRAKIKKIITSVADAEASFLNYWDKESQDLDRDLKQAFYTLENEKNPFSKWNPTSWPNHLFVLMNRWPKFMQFNRIITLLGQYVLMAGSATTMVVAPLAGLGSFAQPNRALAAYVLFNALWVSAGGYFGLKFFLWNYRLHMSILRALHRRLRHVRAIGEAAQEISELAYGYEKFGNGLSLKHNAQEFYLNPEELSKNLPKMLNILTRNVFTKEKFGAFSHAGNVLAGHDYMLEVKNAYHKAYEVVGELSVMLAAAEMIVEHPNRFCFPEFYEADKPEFSAIGLRNLLFGQDAIPHDVHLGGAKTSRVMLLTGPNGAGKSGLLVSASQAIMCAQALGFAAAHRLRMTPFKVIESFSNVKEDPSKNLSRFMAERMRSKYIMPKLRNLKQGEFAWLGIDEPNSGTTGDVADQRSYKLYKNIASFPNVLCVGTTHQEAPTTLESETDGIVKNFHPVVERDEHTGNWIRNFKIIAGKPDWWFSSEEKFRKMRMQYTKKFY